MPFMDGSIELEGWSELGHEHTAELTPVATKATIGIGTSHFNTLSSPIHVGK